MKLLNHVSPAACPAVSPLPTHQIKTRTHSMWVSSLYSCLYWSFVQICCWCYHGEKQACKTHAVDSSVKVKARAWMSFQLIKPDSYQKILETSVLQVLLLSSSACGCWIVKKNAALLQDKLRYKIKTIISQWAS